MHDPVFLHQGETAARLFQMRFLIEQRPAADGLYEKKNRNGDSREKQTDPAGKTNSAQAENSKQNDQLQETAADVCEACCRQRRFQRLCLRLQQKTKVCYRNKCENQGNMHVVLLFPDHHIYRCQRKGKNKDSKIVGLHVYTVL